MKEETAVYRWKTAMNSLSAPPVLKQRILLFYVPLRGMKSGSVLFIAVSHLLYCNFSFIKKFFETFSGKTPSNICRHTKEYGR